ncbi:MAG TPA: nicotinamide riboside transporter PnuC [Terracidiphilus sp.]|nr:nicotinamide riboside transporter PnuC [Terracidiphilus sp.]
MSWGGILSYCAVHGLELAAMAATVLGIWLTTRRLLICWPITLLADFLYLAVFIRARLFSDALLQIFFVAFTLYGWWHWWRGVRQVGEVRVEPLGKSACAWALAAGAVGSALLGGFMIWIGGLWHIAIALPHLDATLASYSLVASWWGARKHIANWWLWIAVDVIYVGEYVYKDLWPTALLYLGLVALAVLGLRDWRRAQAAQSAACTTLRSGSPAM